MGLFESLKRTFNIGGCAIEISPSNNVFHLGDRITGTVLLRGGDYPQEATELKISLVEFWTERRGSGKGRRTVTVTAAVDSTVLSSPCSIEVGSEHSYQFALLPPLDGRLSTPGDSAGWRLEVDLDIPKAIDPSRSLCLRVAPAPALLELVRLWVEVLQWSESPSHRSWDRKRRRTSLHFIPPVELQGDFDHLELNGRPFPNGDWHVTMEFDLQEKGITDRLKALVDMDKFNRELTIPAAALSGKADRSSKAARIACATSLARIMKEIVDVRQ